MMKQFSSRKKPRTSTLTNNHVNKNKDMISEMSSDQQSLNESTKTNHLARKPTA